MQSEARRLLEAMQTDEGDADAVATLLQDAMAADIVPSSIRDEERRSLVELAIRRNQPHILDVLLTHGGGTMSDDETRNDDDRRGRSPLCLAVELRHTDCARILLAHGASVDAPSRADGSLHTPLHVAAMFDMCDRFFHEVLLAASTRLDARDVSDNTPLHLAAAYGSYGVACALLTTGADVNAPNASASTPLHLACANGFVSIVELLLDHGADVNALDVLGNTPLIDAAFVRQSPTGHFAYGDAVSQSLVIQQLLHHGAEVDACNRDGNPAICGAVRNGYKHAVLALLDRGASAAKRNRHGESVLHVAASAGVVSVEIWKRLLVAGADVLARDRYDRTCYGIWTTRPKLVVSPERPEGDEDQDDDDDDRTILVDSKDDDSVALMLEAAIMAQMSERAVNSVR